MLLSVVLATSPVYLTCMPRLERAWSRVPVLGNILCGRRYRKIMKEVHTLDDFAAVREMLRVRLCFTPGWVLSPSCTTCSVLIRVVLAGLDMRVRVRVQDIVKQRRADPDVQSRPDIVSRFVAYSISGL
jgi:hypothetical protein